MQGRFLMMLLVLASPASAAQWPKLITQEASMTCDAYLRAIERSPKSAKAWAAGYFVGMTNTLDATGRRWSKVTPGLSLTLGRSFADTMVHWCKKHQIRSFDDVAREAVGSRSKEPLTPVPGHP